MKKLCINFCLVIVIFLVSVFKSFSQKPETLIGTWKGKYVEEGLTIREKNWFDHYLKGEKPADWMVK